MDRPTTSRGKRGLSDAEVTALREKYGTNAICPPKRKSFGRKFLENLSDPVIKILLCALAVNLLFLFRGGDWIESVGIAASIFLATFISTLSEHGSESAFQRLDMESERTLCRVWRGGRLCELPIEELVVGDFVLLGAGERIPADGLLREGRLRVDQSAMTGESREVEKRVSADLSLSPSSPSSALRGCMVHGGEAVMEVLRVGDATFLGEISREVQSETRQSPLKIRLAKLASQISKLGYLAAILVAVAYLFDSFVLDSGMRTDVMLIRLADPTYVLGELLHAFMLGLTVIVVAVPEGLPMMIAVVLSSNIKRMIRDQVLVRKPVGIEAAGSMNILFTDKTGTLTEGKLGVEEIIGGDGRVYRDLAAWRREQKSTFSLFALSCCYNTAAVPGEGGAIGGNGTDRALLESVLGVETPTARLISKVGFDSARKFSAATVDMGRRLTFIKGAPELLLPYLCYENREGGRAFLDRSALEAGIRQMTGRGKRVLLVAYAEGSGISPTALGELTLLCAVCLGDRLRLQVPSAVKKLRGAGIQVVMITGDSKPTATAIAAQSGILTGGFDLVLTSEELSSLSDSRLKELLPRLAVVARALPNDKSRLVRVAQEMELVVGMTGDGINDAPALKRADIGFAMGDGTQVAREAGDIILLDNDLSSLVKAVLYGRNIFKSIRKFIVLQLTMNFCAVGVSMICPFLGIDAPVTVVQMLWINIIMDTLGGLAFAGEAPLESCMRERPKRRDEPILNGYMIHQILLLGGFTVALCLAFLKTPEIVHRFRPAENDLYLLTAFFALFIFASVFNCFNCRTDRLNLFAGLWRNKIFILIMLAIGILQIAFVYLGGSVLRTAPLTGEELRFTLLLSLSVFPAELLRKLLWRIGGGRSRF